MSSSWSPSAFPNLNGSNCRVTSPATHSYNCIAYAAGETCRVWWPDSFKIAYWPEGVQRVATVEAFVEAYKTIGYIECASGMLEPGLQKIALYAKTMGNFQEPTHAALQLESGQWTSKLGDLEDIEHSHAEDVQGDEYGQVVRYMSRLRA